MKNINEIIWEGWTVEGVLGKGSYGTVYKASKTGFNSKVYSAIKHLSIPYDSSEIQTIRAEGMTKSEIKSYYEDIVNHIADEIRLMDNFKGTANIVSIEDFKIIQDDDISWNILIRMEILSDLNEYFSNKTGPISDIVTMGIDICNALECCEKEKIIHRDIKPENIFVNKFGNFKLGDFGIAREYTENRADMSMRGTPYYVAPEIFEGKQYDYTVDLYSLGIVLYRLLNNNRLPFFPVSGVVTFQNRNEAVKRRISGERFAPPINSIPELTEVINKACAKNPSDRYQSAYEMKQDLSNVLNLLNSMGNQPCYEFIQAEIENDKSVNTYDLEKGTLLLEDNVVSQSKPNKSNRKKLMFVLAFALVFISIATSILVSANGKKDNNEISIENSQTANYTQESLSVPEKTTKETTKKPATKEATKAKSKTTAKAVSNKSYSSYTTKKKTVKRKKKATTTKKKAKKSRPQKKVTTTKKMTTTKKRKATTKKAANGRVRNIKMSYSKSSIHVSWSKATNAAGYDVTMTGVNSYYKSFHVSSSRADFLVGRQKGKYTVKIVPVFKDGTKGNSVSKSYTVK